MYIVYDDGCGIVMFDTYEDAEHYARMTGSSVFDTDSWQTVISFE